jgi:hypothetical protein
MGGRDMPAAWPQGKGKWQEESSFFGKKEAKKLYPFGGGSADCRAPSHKSFFASFFSKKEDSCLLPA